MYGQYTPPYAMGATPQMQQRLQALQQYNANQQLGSYQPGGYPVMPIQQQPYIKGRFVGGVEEAKAAQVDLDGSSTFFPAPAEGKIYEKLIDMNGLPVFRVYRLVKEEEKKPVYADTQSVQELKVRIERLEKAMTGGVCYESVPANANVTRSKQPGGTNAANDGAKPAIVTGNANGAGQESATDARYSSEPSTPAWYE